MSNIIDKSVKNFWVLIALAFLVGAGLRIYMVSDQIPLDDEWHGIEYVTNNSFSYLFTHSGNSASCIPLNLYHRFLLSWLVWSEFWLRLPWLASGILCVAVFPILVRKIIGQRSAVIFAFLLAVSPFLVFYSRVCRPYSMYTFTGFVSILSLYFWTSSGERKYAVIYVLAGIIAIYLHLLAAIAVFVPMGCVFAVKLMHRKTGFLTKRVQVVPSLLKLTLAAVSIIIPLFVLVLPALLQSKLGALLGVHNITPKTFSDFAYILSGTTNKSLVVSLLGLFGFGLILLLRERPLLGSIFFFTVVGYFVALAIFRSELIHIVIVISRYVIVIYPIVLVLAAFGMDGILKFFQSNRLLRGRRYGTALANIIAAAFITALFWAGPLTEIYARPNNFTNHSAFQESYKPLRWDKPYHSEMVPELSVYHRSGVPTFYQRLLNEPDTKVIIEYPMYLGDICNLYYYYQHFHRKKIIVGYFTELEIKELKSIGNIYSNMTVDEVFSKVADTSKLKFKNMINMTDISALRQSRARYVILHKNLAAEFFPRAPDIEPTYVPVDYLSNLYKVSFGPAVFEDKELIVFRVRAPG